MVWYLYPVIHMLLEICDFYFKYTLEHGVKSQESASDAYPTFCSSGEYLGINLNYWMPQANVLQLFNSTCWGCNLKVCYNFCRAQRDIFWIQCKVHTMDARLTFPLGLHAWFLLIQLQLIVHLRPPQLRTSAVVPLTTKCFLLGWCSASAFWDVRGLV